MVKRYQRRDQGGSCGENRSVDSDAVEGNKVFHQRQLWWLKVGYVCNSGGGNGDYMVWKDGLMNNFRVRFWKVEDDWMEPKKEVRGSGVVVGDGVFEEE